MRASFVVAALLAAVGGAAACRDADESCDVEDHADVSGAWDVELTVTQDTCDPEDVGQVTEEAASIAQSGRDITIDLDSASPILTGHICGESFTANGSETEEFLGCTWTETVSARGAVSGGTLTGSVTWSVRVSNSEDCLGAESCNGGYDVRGVRP